MRKKILLAAIFIIFWASVCAIFYFQRNPIGEKVIWDMTGAFINADGTEEAITVSISGKIIEDENGYYTVYGHIDLPLGYPYMLGDTQGAMISMNQKNDHLSHLMLFNSYVYHAPSNMPVFMYFGLDLENESLIMLFENAPNCYLVASRDSSVGTQQLLAHFKDFIDSEAERFWS